MTGALGQLTGVRDEHGHHTAHLAMNMLRFEGLIPSNDKDLEFSSILQRRKSAHCKLSPDVVYSVIGAAVVKPQICVDYRLSFEDVFARATSQIILMDGTLSILKELDFDRTTDTVLPTWTPDWRLAGFEASRSLRLPPLYAATGSSRAIPRSTDNEQVLTLQGLNWDIIRSTCLSSPFQETRDWAIQVSKSSTGTQQHFV